MKNYKVSISRMAHAVKMFFLGGVLAMTCSCEDFLTISPTDKIILEDFWKSKEDVNNMLFESYRLMASSDFLNRLIVWGEMRSDNVVEGNYETRENIIYHLTMNEEWEIDCEVSSSNNIWYLFVNHEKKVSVSINCGMDSIFDDIVITKFS